MIMNYLTGTSSSASSSSSPSSSSSLAVGGSSSSGKKGVVTLDETVSEKLSRINEAFVANIVATLNEHPDALLFPVLDSYVRHVQTVLSPHLPKDLMGEDNNSLSNFTKFLDKFKVAMMSGSGGPPSDVASESVFGGGAAKPRTAPTATTTTTTTGARAIPTFSNNGPLTKSSTAGFQSSLEKLPGFTLFPPSRIGSSIIPPPQFSVPNNPPMQGIRLGLQPLRAGGILKRPAEGASTGNVVPQKMPDKPFARLDMLQQNSMGGGGGGFKFLPMPVPPSIQTATVSASPRSTDVGVGGQQQQHEQEEEESEEPPKNEFKQVKEDDSLYEIRCKIFGKLNGAYKDKGIGVLYIKKSDAGKYQVVVRAENNLGTILLNILLTKDLPVTANGMKVITCDLSGDNGKPLSIVIKVKSEADATELSNKLIGYCKLSHSS